MYLKKKERERETTGELGALCMNGEISPHGSTWASNYGYYGVTSTRAGEEKKKGKGETLKKHPKKKSDDVWGSTGYQ
jgi:hypothetical protein